MYPKYKNVYTIYNPSIIEKFIKTQKDNINKKLISCNECFVVLDNCFLNTDYNDYHLTDLLVNGKIYKTINIISATSLHPFSKYFKPNIDYLCVFNNTHIIYINLLYEEFFKNIIDYKEYIYLLDKYTQNYGCIIVDFKDKGKMYYF